jgi:large subunit ribosomal protein L16
MGGGKGAVDRWVAVVRRGRILYEIADVSEEDAREALRRASHKLSIPTRIVARSDEF